MTLKEHSPVPSATVLALMAYEQRHGSLTPIKKQRAAVKRRKPADARDAWFPTGGDRPDFAEPVMRINLSAQRFLNRARFCDVTWPYLCTMRSQLPGFAFSRTDGYRIRAQRPIHIRGGKKCTSVLIAGNRQSLRLEKPY
jgi:hypothetical protein